MLYYMTKKPLPISLEYHCFTNMKNFKNPFWVLKIMHLWNFFFSQNECFQASLLSYFRQIYRDNVFLSVIIECRWIY